MNYVIVLCTAPEANAKNISRAVVKKKLAACVNIIKVVESVYFWDGKIVEDSESLLIIKTKADKFDALKEEINKIHPYDVVEIIAVDIKDGDSSYLSWIGNYLS